MKIGKVLVEDGIVLVEDGIGKRGETPAISLTRSKTRRFLLPPRDIGMTHPDLKFFE